MNPEALAEAWEKAAQQDAMFNILTDPEKVDCGWDADDFFATGEAEVTRVMERLDGVLDVHYNALDFGCGVGRLSRALYEYFDSVTGVDVSPTMIKLARDYAVDYGVKFTTRLPRDEFDLIYSTITLQHIPPYEQQRLLAAFVDRLSDDGVMAVHLPEGPNYDHPQTHLSMWCATPSAVVGWIGKAGGGVVDIWDEGQDGDYRNWRYIARRLP